jgi:hypothetical protein
MGKQAAFLKGITDAPFAGRHPAVLVAIKPVPLFESDPAGYHRAYSGNGIQQGRFAAAGSALYGSHSMAGEAKIRLQAKTRLA